MADPDQLSQTDNILPEVTPEQWLLQSRRAPTMQAMNALEDDPEEAAESDRLGQSIGVPGSIVKNDLEEYQRQHKAALTSELFNNNEHLREYVHQHPLGASVSNDDWGQLDTVSQSLAKLGLPTKLGRAIGEAAHAVGAGSVAEKAVEAFKEGFGKDEIEPQVHQLLGNETIANAVMNIVKTNPAYYAPRLMQGVLYASAAAGGQLLTNLTGSEVQGQKLARDLLILPQVAIPELAGAVVPPELQALAHASIKNVEPHIMAGKVPPVGTDKVMDQVHSEQAKLDLKNLDEAFKESQASATRERSPELFSDFIKQHTDSRIGIDAGEVRRLYGDKVPEADDNLLGWVPRIQEQLSLAEAHGGDIEVPLADWLAKADPEVAKELHDFIRVRPGGMTLEETKEAGKPVELEPSIKLEPEEGTDTGYAINDSTGKRIASADIAIHGDQATVMNIYSEGGENSLGPTAMREVLRQFQEQHPEVTTIGGKRVSGARAEDAPVIAVDTLRKSAGLEPLFGPRATRDIGIAERPGTHFIIAPEKVEIGIPVELKDAKAKSIASFPLKDSLDVLPSDTGTGWLTTLPQKIFAEKLASEVGNVPIHVVSGEDMDALAKANGWDHEIAGYAHSDADDPSQDHIVIRDTIADGSRSPGEAIRTVLHEGSHIFMQRTIEKYPELAKTLERIMGGAKEALKDHVNIKYFNHLNYLDDIHEFIAGAHSDPFFWDALNDHKIPDDLRDALALKEKSPTFWDAFREVFKQLWKKAFGAELKDDTYLDAVLRASDFIERLRGKGEEGAGRVAATKTPEMAERDLFTKANAIGMTKDQYQRYMDLISKRAAEDLAHQVEQGKAIERERQTKEWKDNFSRVREEVRANIRNRSDIAADRLLREGDLHGQKVQRPALDSAALSPEQKALLPEGYARAGGVSPDVVAGLFGYQSGDSLVSALGRLKQERELEGLTPAAHLSKIVDAATERKMRKEYGNLEENILADAKDHVISQTQMDMLHEETLALGQQSGASLPMSKDDFKRGAKELFDGTPLGSHSTDKYLADAGRAGRKAEQALLEGKPGDAFKAKQQQYISLLLANEAKKLEKKEASFDSKVKNWQKREPTGMNQEDAVWLHQILNQIGKPARRSIQDLDRQKELVSPYKNLREYVEGSNKVHGTYNEDVDAIPPAQQLNVADFLFSDNYRKTIDEMTPQEFEDVFNSLKSIDHYSRDTKRYTVKGNKVAINDVVSGLVARLKAAVDNKAITNEARQKQSAGRLVGTWLLNPETWMNRLDLGNRMGPFNQLIIRPIVEGQYLKKTYERSFAKQWKELGDFTDLTKKIENPLFRDPETGDPIQLRKENAYAILQNMGNALQRQKLVLGWRVSKDVEEGTQRIWNWLASVGITKDDLSRAQKMGDMFDKAFSLSETAYTHVAGVAPERIELKTVQTPWGEAKEWYHPLIPDPLRHSSKLNIDDMMGDSGYWRPSPASGYTKGRTGALYPIDLTFDSVPFKLKQILNDAAMRIPITEVSKIVYHNDFKAAFKKYYGVEYASALDGWMKDVAGNRQWVPSNMKALDQAVTTIQQNLSTLLIGWNLGTVAKHAPTAALFSATEVGTARFAKSLSKIIYELPGSQETWSFVHENSEEVRNRMRSLEDTLIAQNREMFKKVGWKGKVASFRDSVEWYGHAPVAFTDLISAVAMWHAEYGRLAEEKPELSHGDLVYAADTAVRRTHGSSILSNRPGIMRYNSPFARLIVPFYNFMSNALQRCYEVAWKSKLATQGRELPEMTGFEKAEQFEAGPQHIRSIIGGVMVYGVMVSLIEQMVDPLPDNKENRALHWAKILTRGYPSMIPGVRDAINYLYEGHDPSLGLYGTFARNVDKAIDPKSYTHDPGKTFRTLNTLFGTLTGLTFEPLGRVGQFAFNVAAGHEHPKGMGDLFKGMYRGTLKEPRR